VGSVTQIKIDQVAVRNMFRSPTGMVGRRLIAQGKEIERLASEKAAKHNMRDWVHSTPLPSLYGVNVLIYCDHPAAVYVLGGTRPHDIHYTKPQALQFKVGWRTVTVVHHPGYRGDNFLKTAMEEARI
jgi:hypothetical protein